MWAIFLCHSYTQSWSAVFSLQATLSPMQALLFPGEHFRKLFWCLAKLVQLGAWLQGLLWQHEQPIRGKAVFSVGVWGVCLCVHMGVCSTEERNDITTKGGLVTPHKTPRCPRSHVLHSQLSGPQTQLQLQFQDGTKSIVFKLSRLVLCLWKSPQCVFPPIFMRVEFLLYLSIQWSWRYP